MTVFSFREPRRSKRCTNSKARRYACDVVQERRARSNTPRGSRPARSETRKNRSATCAAVAFKSHALIRRSKLSACTKVAVCAAASLEIDGELGDFGYCRCRSCRKASGSAHAANVPVGPGAFRLTRGADLLREFESSPGKVRTFCSRCGSPLYALSGCESGALTRAPRQSRHAFYEAPEGAHVRLAQSGVGTDSR
jgi:hypothetical protein